MRLCIRTLAVLSLHLFASSSAGAKNIDYSPDLTSEEYWKQHYITLVRVDAVEGKPSNPMITFSVVRGMTDKMPAKSYRVPLSFLWFGVGEGPPALHANDALLLFLHKKGSSPFVVIRSDARGKGAGLIHTLSGIKHIREASKDPRALLDGVLCEDPVVSIYSMKELLQKPRTLLTPELLVELGKMRDREEVAPRARILGSMLMVRSGSATRDDHYDWIKSGIGDSKTLHWKDLNQFVDELLAYPERRKEAVLFLAGKLVENDVRLDVRIAAYGALTDPRAFNYSQPFEEVSESILTTYFVALRHREPVIRAAAAMQIHAIGQGIRRGRDRITLCQKALEEVEAALGVEDDADTRRTIEQVSAQIRAILGVPGAVTNSERDRDR